MVSQDVNDKSWDFGSREGFSAFGSVTVSKIIDVTLAALLFLSTSASFFRSLFSFNLGAG